MTRIQNFDLMKFMTKEEIQKACPLAYRTEPTRKVSDKYVMANTATVIDDMEKLGWKVVEAKQRKASKRGNGTYSYHMISFQHPDVHVMKTIDGEAQVDCYPRIILTNSHDGLNCFRFMVGLYRMVCSNGLVIATDQMSDLKIRHIYYDFNALREILAQAIGQVEMKLSRMGKAVQTILSEEQKRDLALKALAIRKNQKVEEMVVNTNTLDNMLEPVRQEDEGDSLWNVFNVLQEKVVKGGFGEVNIQNEQKVRKVRPVKSFVKDLWINQRLWEAMEEYIPAEEVAAA